MINLGVQVQLKVFIEYLLWLQMETKKWVALSEFLYMEFVGNDGRDELIVCKVIKHLYWARVT